MHAGIEERLAEKNREDTRDAWMLIGMGLPFAVGGVLFLSAGIFAVIALVPMGIGWAAKFWIAAGLVLAAVLVDVWRHPSEQWYRAQYYLTDGTLADAVDFGVGHMAADGWFAGMPAMTSVTDPSNLATRGRAISSGCANAVLGGPRNIRQGIETLALVSRRSGAAARNAADAVFAWLQAEGPVDETAVAAVLVKTPVWRPGFALLSDVGLLAFKRADGRRTVEIKQRALASGPP